MINPIKRPDNTLGKGFDVVYCAPSLDDYVRLREETGTVIHDLDAAARGLGNTDFAVSVRYEGETIGFTRVISDGGVWYYMVDETLSPAHNNPEIRQFMVRWVLYQFHEVAPPGAYMFVLSHDPDFHIDCGLKPLDAPEEAIYTTQPMVALGEAPMTERFEKPSDDLGPGYSVIYEMVDKETFIRFRNIGKLGAKDPDAVAASIANTHFAVQVHYHGECVAFCRSLGDRGLWHHMADGIVLPEHQASGIGKYFVSRLIYHFYETAAPGAHMLAFTWAPDFGVKSGFKRVPENEVGLYAWQPIGKPEEDVNE